MLIFFSPLRSSSWTNSTFYCKSKSPKKRVTFSPHRNTDSLKKYSASKFYKYIVNKKGQHIDNVVVGVLCFASSVIVNKTYNPWTTIYETITKRIGDKVLERWFKLRMWYSGRVNWKVQNLNGCYYRTGN